MRLNKAVVHSLKNIGNICFECYGYQIGVQSLPNSKGIVNRVHFNNKVARNQIGGSESNICNAWRRATSIRSLCNGLCI